MAAVAAETPTLGGAPATPPPPDIAVDLSGKMNIPRMDGGRQPSQYPQQQQPYNFRRFTRFQRVPNPIEFINRAREYTRPWSVFLNWTNLKSAASLPRLSSRFLRNLQYFQSNYLFVCILLMIYCLLTSPLLLFVLAGIGFATHKIKQSQAPIQLLGTQLSPTNQMLGLYLISVPFLIWVGAGSALFWMIGASFCVICMHAIFYNIDAIVTEEADGFLSEVV